jgi:anti-sigma factor RsiW
MSTEPTPPIGEDDLHGFVDGLLDPGRIPAVAAYLAARPDEAARVQALVAQRNALRAALAFKAAEPIPARLRLAHLRGARRQARLARLRVAAAVAGLLVAGAGFGWSARAWLEPDAPPPLVASAPALLHQALAAPAHRVEAAPRGADLGDWLAERLDPSMHVPDLGEFGFAPDLAWVLTGGKGMAAVLRYAHADGATLSVWRRPTHDTAPEAMRCTDEPGGLVSYGWSDGRHLFAVTAALPRDRLRPIALAVERAMRAPPPPGLLLAGTVRRPCLDAVG